jgi:uncharacterized protein YjeT (DUF2065 family)
MFTPKFLLTAMIVYIGIVLLPALLHPRKFRKAIKPLLSDIKTLRLMGFISLLFGMIFLSVQWKFEGEWLMIIPILGWLGVIKGANLFWFPESMKKLSKQYFFKSDKSVALMAIIGLVAGIGLTHVTLNLI